MHFLYVYGLKPLFFLGDPEKVHDGMVGMGRLLGKSSVTRGMLSFLFSYSHSKLSVEVLGMKFSNPILLSAGFDKNGELTRVIPNIGFGGMEIGSVTGKVGIGNDRPRLWRLPKSKSLLVYYGLKNDGADIVAERVRKDKMKESQEMVYGMSVAMTNCKENLDIQNGIEDFAKAFTAVEDVATYITINISCPNTCGGQPFMIPQNLETLLSRIDAIPTSKPIFVKLSPDCSLPELDTILDILKVHKVKGIICTNLTKNRDNKNIIETNIPHVGGLSGKVVEELSNKMIEYIYKREGARFVIVGCGGIFTAQDAYKKIRLGATLLQMITGMIFEGPEVISEINQGLVRLLTRDGFKNISNAVGVDNLR